MVGYVIKDKKTGRYLVSSYLDQRGGGVCFAFHDSESLAYIYVGKKYADTDLEFISRLRGEGAELEIEEIHTSDEAQP